MTVTAHYIHEKGHMAVDLIAFRMVEGSHTGANIACILFGIFEEFDIIHKASQT